MATDVMGARTQQASVAVLGPRARDRHGDNALEHRLGRRTLGFALVPTVAPDWDPADEQWRSMVAVRVVALSCNYRDRSYLALVSDRLAEVASVPFAHFGSDFVGEVVRVGDEVTGLRAGDLVIPTMDYPSGVLTNEASCGWITAPAERFVRVPTGFDVARAAGLALGAQTAAAMVRRAGIGPGDRVLVMSANSATSRFLVPICRAAGVGDVALSSARRIVTEAGQSSEPVLVRGLGTGGDPGGREGCDGNEGHEALPEGAFDVVLDPFSDLNLPAALRALDVGGRYVTCGFASQYAQPELARGLSWVEVAESLIAKNLTLVGNCLGAREDLMHALKVLTVEDVPAFPVFGLGQVDDFLAAFLGDGRGGKGVLMLDGQ